MVRLLFYGGPRALGLLGSVEVARAGARCADRRAWLLARFGWRASFGVIAALSLALAVLVVAMRHRLPGAPGGRPARGGTDNRGRNRSTRINQGPCVLADRLWVKDCLDPEEEKLSVLKLGAV